MLKRSFIVAILLSVTLLVACSSRSYSPKTEVSLQSQKMKFNKVPSIPALLSGEVVPPEPKETQMALKKAGKAWFFGRGLGKTAINITGIVLFPPYGLYLLGNAGLELAGVGGVYPSQVLPDGPRKHVEDFYGSVCDIPGLITSSVAGVEFQKEG